MIWPPLADLTIAFCTGSISSSIVWAAAILARNRQLDRRIRNLTNPHDDRSTP